MNDRGAGGSTDEVVGCPSPRLGEPDAEPWGFRRSLLVVYRCLQASGRSQRSSALIPCGYG